MRLLPREEKFFHYFNEQASLISQAADMLSRGVSDGGPAMVVAAAEMARLESKGDEIIHEIFTKLNQTFITPLDPEDIHSLGSHMDDVLDSLEETSHRIVTYRVHPVPPPMVEFCGIIVACAASLSKAILALSQDRPMLEHCIEINRLEDQADHLLRQQISDLFDREKDPIALIKLKEIYEGLEFTTDCCEDVADALQNVVVKNG